MTPDNNGENDMEPYRDDKDDGSLSNTKDEDNTGEPDEDPMPLDMGKGKKNPNGTLVELGAGQPYMNRNK